MLVLPFNISFEDWAASLIIDLPTQNVPQPFGEENWREWAESLLLLDVFADIPLEVSEPDSFDDWRTWAERVVGIVYT